MTATETNTAPPDPAPQVQVAGAAGTVIGAAHGPTHSGVGDLLQVFTTLGQERRRRGPSSYDELTEEQLAGLFVPPQGYDDAQSTLLRSRVVILHGPLGCGRFSTAVRLLSERRTGDGGPIRILDSRDDDHEEREPLLGDDITEAALLLLDLSDVDDQPGLRSLAGLLNLVRTRGAFVVVVLGRTPDQSVPDELRRAGSRIGRPPGSIVFQRHLDGEGVVALDPPEWSAELRNYVDGSSMAEIRELAILTRDARDAEPHSGFMDWVAVALTRARSRDVEIARSLDIPESERHRTLAFAAAMFAGCPAEVVVDAERRLMHAIGVDRGDEHELAGPDFGARLGRVHARLAGDHVHFDGFHHASAVRGYFWTQFPALRRGFHNWIVGAAPLVRGTELADEAYVERYTDLALRTGQPDLVAAAVVDWASRDRELLFAATALYHGILDRRHSRHFRLQCYQWAISPTVPSNLAHLVVSACTTTIAPVWPNQAIVRLHHLTRHPDIAVAEAAQSGLVTVVQDDFALISFLTRLVERSLVSQIEDQWLFLCVVEAERFATVDLGPLSSEPVRERLTRCWAAVFRLLPKSDYEPAVRRWLTAHAAHEDDTGLPRILARAASAARRLPALHGITHRWLAEPVADPDRHRRAVARLLLHEIDRQLEALAPDSARTNEGSQ